MPQTVLSSQPRTLTRRRVKNLRSEGLIPANVFGKKIQSQVIQIGAKDFSRIYAQVGESSLVYLDIKGESDHRPTLISSVSYHPVTRQVLHVSFHQVNLKEKVTAPVKIILTGQPLAVADGLGVMVQRTNEVQIEALPTDMPENLTLDVSSLHQVGSTISVHDLNLDKSKITVVTDPDVIIVKIDALAKEEVVAPPPSPLETAPGTASQETLPPETPATPETSA